MYICNTYKHQASTAIRQPRTCREFNAFPMVCLVHTKKKSLGSMNWPASSAVRRIRWLRGERSLWRYNETRLALPLSPFSSCTLYPLFLLHECGTRHVKRHVRRALEYFLQFSRTKACQKGQKQPTRTKKTRRAKAG